MTIRIELIRMGGGVYASNVINKIEDSVNHDESGPYEVPNISSNGFLYGRFTVLGAEAMYVNVEGTESDGPGCIRLVPEFPEVIALTGGSTLNFTVGDT